MKQNHEEGEVIMNNNTRGSTAVAFLLGAVAGGITALLLAPQSGADTRRRLKRGAHDLRETGGRMAHEMGARAELAKGAMSEAKHTYRDELDKRRASTATEPKGFAETESASSKVRAGTQS